MLVPASSRDIENMHLTQERTSRPKRKFMGGISSGRPGGPGGCTGPKTISLRGLQKGVVKNHNVCVCLRLSTFARVSLRLFAFLPLRLLAFVSVCLHLLAFARICLRPPLWPPPLRDTERPGPKASSPWLRVPENQVFFAWASLTQRRRRPWLEGSQNNFMQENFGLIFRSLLSGTKNQPKEEVLGRVSLWTCGQKLRSGPQILEKTSILAQPSRTDVHDKTSV